MCIKNTPRDRTGGEGGVTVWRGQRIKTNTNAHKVTYGFSVKQCPLNLNHQYTNIVYLIHTCTSYV